MFALSKATEYAVLFLTSLAKKEADKPVNLRHITKKTGLPYKFLSRIVLDLKKAKIIESKEGVGGGYFLARSSKDINLIDIIEAIEGKKGLVSCIHGKCLMEKSCLHKKVWQRLQAKVTDEFEQITLNDLT